MEAPRTLRTKASTKFGAKIKTIYVKCCTVLSEKCAHPVGERLHFALIECPCEACEKMWAWIRQKRNPARMSISNPVPVAMPGERANVDPETQALWDQNEKLFPKPPFEIEEQRRRPLAVPFELAKILVNPGFPKTRAGYLFFQNVNLCQHLLCTEYVLARCKKENSEQTNLDFLWDGCGDWLVPLLVRVLEWDHPQSLGDEPGGRYKMMLDIFTLIAVGLADTATDMLTEKRTLERIFWVRVMFDNYKMPKFFPARWLLVKALDYAITNPDYVGKSKTEAKQKELEDKPQDRIEEIPDDKPQADHPIQEQK